MRSRTTRFLASSPKSRRVGRPELIPPIRSKPAAIGSGGREGGDRWGSDRGIGLKRRERGDGGALVPLLDCLSRRGSSTGLLSRSHLLLDSDVGLENKVSWRTISVSHLGNFPFRFPVGKRRETASIEWLVCLDPALTALGLLLVWTHLFIVWIVLLSEEKNNPWIICKKK